MLLFTFQRNNEQGGNKESNGADGTKQYVCSKCYLVFNNVEEYHSHFILHTQENNKKNYRCSICYKIFATPERIQVFYLF